MRVLIDGDHIDTKSVVLEKNKGYALRLIDQRLLPHQLKFIKTKDYQEAISWISNMAVRGAPAIGATGAYALILALQELKSTKDIDSIIKKIISARPTAKDLHTFVDGLGSYAKRLDNFNLSLIAQEANRLAIDSEEECRLIGEVGKSLIKTGMGILTHCNAGALATVDWGTALSPMRFANNEGIKFKVFVDETRPRLQGMLTSWELLQEEIDHEIIADNAAGYFMQNGDITLVITGTDRVLKDGSVANKIGTLEKAVVAKYYGIPFYIAMPWTTYDPDLESPSDIPIEFRDPDEVTSVSRGTDPNRIAPEGAKATNPAFDITPPDLITGYITRDGIFTQNELHNNYLKWLNS